MKMGNLILSPKYKAFIRCKAPVEFLEGTTAAGKTTVGIYKFILKVADSPKKIHILSGLDLGTIEKNIINKDLGIVDVFGALVEYNANGKGEHSLPHIVLHTGTGNKIIYVLGYDNKARWKKALGGQYGCLYIDEINIADMEYVREASMRCDYMMATLNPDDPNLPVYKEYINCSRPLPKWRDETPKEIQNMLIEEPKPGWVHWFFSFEHNYGLSPEKIAQIKMNVPKGTKLYKNKILGLRGRSTGLVFANFEREIHVKPKRWAEQFKTNDRYKERFARFVVGVDTAYSQKSPDTISILLFAITTKGKGIVLSERVYNNAKLQSPIAPSDTVQNIVDFMDRISDEWGFCRYCFIDCADQATLTEAYKYKKNHGCIYEFVPSYKKLPVKDRIKLQLNWFATESFYYIEDCANCIEELNLYSWKEDKDNEPEDGHDHTINACQYAWLPYKEEIGAK